MGQMLDLELAGWLRPVMKARTSVVTCIKSWQVTQKEVERGIGK